MWWAASAHGQTWAATQWTADAEAATGRAALIEHLRSKDDFTLLPRPDSAPHQRRPVLPDLQRGRLAYGWVPMRTLVTSAPELAVLLEPYLFESAVQAQFVYEQYLSDLVGKLISSRGVVLLGWRPLAPECVRSWFPLRLPADAIGQPLHSATHWTDQRFAQALSARPVVSVSSTPRYVLTTHHRYLMIAVLAYRSWFDQLDPTQQAELRHWHRADGLAIPLEPLRTASDDLRRCARDQDEQGHKDKDVVRLEIGPRERARWAQAATLVGPQLRLDLVERGGDALFAQRLSEAIARGKRVFDQQRGAMHGRMAR